MHVRNVKDFYAGLIFVLFGAAAMFFSTGYRLGTAAKMGPGYLPFALGGVQTLLGLALLGRALASRGGHEGRPSFRLKPVLVVLSSIVLFGLLLGTLGLVLSTALLVIGSSMASHEFRTREALLNAVVMVLIVVIVFVHFLGVQVPVWPPFLVGRT